MDAQSLCVALQRTAALHHHLCPRQVLGVRIGLWGAELLGLDVARQDKNMFAFVETDGCVVDGIAAATGCSIGRRTMHILDFGKVAATFVAVQTGQAIRIVPHSSARQQAWAYAPDAPSRWHAQLLGYQRMPAEELLVAQCVELEISLAKHISRDGYRVNCHRCHEEITNEREVIRDGHVICRSCAGERYYHTLSTLPLQVLENPLGASLDALTGARC